MLYNVEPAGGDREPAPDLVKVYRYDRGRIAELLKQIGVEVLRNALEVSERVPEFLRGPSGLNEGLEYASALVRMLARLIHPEKKISELGETRIDVEEGNERRICRHLFELGLVVRRRRPPEINCIQLLDAIPRPTRETFGAVVPPAGYL